MHRSALLLTLAILQGCDCSPCGDMRLEIVDGQTGEPVLDAEAAVALHIHARRHRVEDSLEPGDYVLWVRAPGYRQVKESVDIPGSCHDIDTGECPTGGVFTVALERR